MEDCSEPGPRPLKGGLLALATAAVVSVYAAGYVRTELAAERLGRSDAGRSAPGSRLTATTPGGAAGVGATIAPTGAATVEGPATAAGSAPVAGPAPASASAAAPAQEAGTPVVPASPAPAAVPATVADASVPATPAASAGAYQDGIYTGWGTSQHGRIEATVEVQGGRIVDAKISTCRMRWPCARIAFLVPQPVERQGTDIDVITRVTDSSDAFYYALVEALSKAK
jgi:uncharacterized protein with FMN-binding domain